MRVKRRGLGTRASVRTDRRRFRIGLGCVALVGFLIRAYHVMSVRAHTVIEHGDAFLSYWLPGRQLAEGRGYISPETFLHCDWDPTEVPEHVLLDVPDRLYALCQAIPSAKHPPGFVTTLAGLNKLGITSMTAQRYAMCVLGAVTIVLVGVLAARLISDRVGLIAAGIAAVYPNVWINDTALWSETLMAFGFVLGLVGIYGFWRKPGWKPLLVASVGITIATSARAEMGALFLLVITPLVLARTALPWRRRVALLAMAAVVPLAVFVPWSVHNAQRFENPVMLSNGLGPTMLAATCDDVYYTKYIGLYRPSCVADLPPIRPPGEGLDESQVNVIARKQAVDYAKEHPGRTARTVLVREARLFELWNPTQQNRYNSYIQGRGSVELMVTAQWMFRILALAAIAGAVLWRRRRIPLYPLVVELVLTMAVVAATFGSTRYRAALEWCLILLAATTFGWLADRAIARYRRWRNPADPATVDDPDDTAIAHVPVGPTHG